MAPIIWANLINMYQPPNCDRSDLEQIVNKSYLPLLKILGQNQKYSFTLSIPASTIDLLIKTGFGQIIKKISEYLENGQIELMTTAKYQPILPLLADDDIDRQIEANNKICKRYFGVNFNPQGLYSPYLAYSQKVSKAAARFGLKWITIDQSSITSIQNGGYSALFMDKSAGGVLLMPRHRDLSDQLEGNIWSPRYPRTSSEFIQNASRICGNDKYFLTICSAESFGYTQPGRANLMRSLYGEPKLRPVTISELRQLVRRKEFTKPVESSIETRSNNNKRKNPFYHWENDSNPIMQTLWQLFNMASAEIRNSCTKGDAQCKRARELMDSAAAGINWSMTSCSPWWNPSFALQVADDLAIAVFVILSSPLKSKETAINLRTKIYDQVEEFEKSGDNKKMQRNFLRSHNIPFEKFNNKPAE